MQMPSVIDFHNESFMLFFNFHYGAHAIAGVSLKSFFFQAKE